ncbi:type II toxin-antitoxin system antitoxin SocA domain-containing protein [Haloferax profundi]|uniref:Antitoxin SocA-like Panacea domain-containing protein n=1 Tax=Haloferax profundi TaxID=1544718 RepID=A0A0W1S8P2_9EURY|nr:type II toxin-antitoxin system antitoxin SocA domain-containing protein [Haloferax profundi]KTG22189.1 hypothetical protein AUR66_17020 [Haloferax profundi]
MPRIDEIDRRTDVVFVVFYFGKSIRGVTKVQKLLFLIEEETSFFEEYRDSIAFNFAPYKMGPFSEEVYEELHFLLQLDAIEARPISDPVIEGSDPDLSNKEFVITAKGEKIASQLVEILEPEYREELRDLVEQYNELSLNELLRHVYSEYPEYTTESEIKDEIFQGTR